MNEHDLFATGFTGTSLTDFERQLLRENSPFAIVLFARNIESPGQLRELVAEIKGIARRAPLLMIDQEGGRVDRLRKLVPGMPAAEAFGEGENATELAAWFGTVTGMALRHLGIDVDLAPVADVRGDVAPKGLERRTFGGDAETVIARAGAFLRGLHDTGVAGCLKHWPGIGHGSGDSHYGATFIDAPRDLLMRRDVAPFRALAGAARAIMIGHGSYPALDAEHPATLSPPIATALLREEIGFDGLAISDDMEMHAVADLASFETITERALLAGNDVISFCSQTERAPELQQHLRQRVELDAGVRARFDEAARRTDAYRDHCAQLHASTPPVSSWDAVLDEAARFVDAFERARSAGTVPQDGGASPVQGTGRTGREEWT